MNLKFLIVKRSDLTNRNYSTAFSLIELSIVILIVGILIAGLLQGSSLLNKAQLTTARNLTKSSPVNSIKNLVAWYETSLETSFLTSEAVDGTAISIWYDNNPQSGFKNNITQSTEANKPKFYENVFGGIPSVRFDGVTDNINGDYLEFDSSALLNTNFTIFVVEKRGDKSTYDMFIAGTSDSAVTGYNIILGYRNSNAVAFVVNGNLDYISGDSGLVPKMHTFWFSSTSGKKYWSNGGKNSDASNSSQKAQVTLNLNSAIGGYKTSWPYIGDIAEVIMFNRDLITEERVAIESYLSQKYNIRISG